MEIIRSSEDDSVNFVLHNHADNGMFEARYVLRPGSDHISVYLSSHSGCHMACRFCHLTATGQTMMAEATLDDFVKQARAVLMHFTEQRGYRPDKFENVKKVHFNFMARGEPLENSVIVNSMGLVVEKLGALCEVAMVNLPYQFNVSTIIPKGAEYLDFAANFHHPNVVLYYSLYSLNENFRRRWLPKAMNPNIALQKLADYQQRTGQRIKLHWAFIEGENDDLRTVADLVNAIRFYKLRGGFNVVRYNPFLSTVSKEPPMEIIERNAKIIGDAIGTYKIIPRVGFDVKASCGMFMEGLTK